jgi:hypothetical protein
MVTSMVDGTQIATSEITSACGIASRPASNASKLDSKRSAQRLTVIQRLVGNPARGLEYGRVLGEHRNTLVDHGGQCGPTRWSIQFAAEIGERTEIMREDLEAVPFKQRHLTPSAAG